MIQFERFEKSYGKVRAVAPLDLQVERGESFALLGPNGSGKTTVLRAVVGLHAPTKGRILVQGFDVVRDADRVKEQLVYVPQRVNMPDLLTVGEVMEVFARLNQIPEERITWILDLFALTDVFDRPTHQLSGGTLQRLGLAVALLREAPLLVLDEPTLNLDPIGVDRLQKLLQALKQKEVTILFSSHLVQTALQLADRVGVLVNGRMVLVEETAQFKASVTRHTEVRIVFSNTVDTAGIRQATEGAGAHVSQCNGRQVCFAALPGQRLDVIRAIEGAGGVIEEFHTEAPDWQALLTDHFDEGTRSTDE